MPAKSDRHAPPSTWTPIPASTPLIAGREEGTAGFVTSRPAGSSDHQIMLTVAGSGLYSSNPAFSTLPGDVIIIQPGMAQSYRCSPDTDHWTYLWVHLHLPATWSSLLDWPAVAPGHLRLRLTDGDLRERVAERLATVEAHAVSVRARRWDFAMNALHEALLWCDSINTRAKPDGLLDPRVRQVRDRLCDDLERPLPRHVLLGATGLSATRLSHLFRVQIGCSMRDFRERRRLQRACDLLRATNLPVQAVAAAVGFDNPFYFSQRFASAFGRSPRAWRRHSDGTML